MTLTEPTNADGGFLVPAHLTKTIMRSINPTLMDRMRTTLLYRSPFYEIRKWFERVWYCHHNARVLADMEYRFGCVLNHTTRGMSKAYYAVDAMLAEIDDFQSEQYDEAYEEGKQEMRDEYNSPLNFALDALSVDDAVDFLTAWREGDYDFLTRVYPQWAIEIAHPEVRT